MQELGRQLPQIDVGGCRDLGEAGGVLAADEPAVDAPASAYSICRSLGVTAPSRC